MGPGVGKIKNAEQEAKHKGKSDLIEGKCCQEGSR